MGFIESIATLKSLFVGPGHGLTNAWTLEVQKYCRAWPWPDHGLGMA